MAWTASIGGILTVIFGGQWNYFNYRSKRDRKTEVGSSFLAIVEGLASENSTKRMAAAVLIRRFFDRSTEQGAAGTPYVKESVALIAGMLREEQPPRLQKVLADGLRYAGNLERADLQYCILSNVLLGKRRGDRQNVNLSEADLFNADCTNASMREIIAIRTVFLGAVLERAILIDADCREADFRDAKLAGAEFAGARIGGARFAGAENTPEEVAQLLDGDLVGLPGAVVGTRSVSAEIGAPS